MSYGYQDPHYNNYEYEYEYVNDGNHGNDSYEHEYEPYSDFMEPDHWEPDHTPSEPDPCEYEHKHNVEPTEYVDHESRTQAEWKTESEGLECRDEVHECEPDWEAFE